MRFAPSFLLRRDKPDAHRILPDCFSAALLKVTLQWLLTLTLCATKGNDMPEPTTFITIANLASLIRKLGFIWLIEKLVGVRGKRREELARIGDVFGDPHQLARFYIEPKCQHHNPADRHEDREPIAQVQEPAFQLIDKFLRGDFTPLGDGRTQLFILSDAGMGKTSLLMMIRLMHLMAFWPRGYDCLLLKLGEDTLEEIDACLNKTQTVLLLDALDEDPLAWGNIESRLVELLGATKRFRRVILSCRTQFFPETGSDPFGRPGQVEVGEYICPMVFLSLFDEDQVDAYLRKRFPDRWRERLWFRANPERLRAAKVVGSMHSLRFRPLLLAHIRDILDAGEQDWNAYRLYRVLVDRWLGREERKLRKQLSEPPSKETLWRVCTAVALHMQSHGSRLLLRRELNTLTEGFPELASLEYFNVGGRSLLNRTAAGAFRFSHYSIQEFLVVHALDTDADRLPPEPLRVTAEMLEFLTFSPRMPDLEHLDLAGLQSHALADFGFQDRLQDGSLGPWMQLILPGEYWMGSGTDDLYAVPNEPPQHLVTITHAFALGRYPVTFEEYDRFAAATGRKRPDDAGWGRGHWPVINISRQDADAYCEWLSEQTGFRYRLPTESEWEYAARAGTRTHWFHGNDALVFNTYGWYRGNAESRAHPVGEKSPIDPSKIDLPDSVPVVRGGSWRDDVESCRSASRMKIPFENLRKLRDFLDHYLCDYLDRFDHDLRDLRSHLNLDHFDRDRLDRDLRDLRSHLNLDRFDHDLRDCLHRLDCHLRDRDRDLLDRLNHLNRKLGNHLDCDPHDRFDRLGRNFFDLLDRYLRDLRSLRDRLDCILQNRFGFRCVRGEAISASDHREPDT